MVPHLKSRLYQKQFWLGMESGQGRGHFCIMEWNLKYNSNNVMLQAFNFSLKDYFEQIMSGTDNSFFLNFTAGMAAVLCLMCLFIHF